MCLLFNSDLFPFIITSPWRRDPEASSCVTSDPKSALFHLFYFLIFQWWAQTQTGSHDQQFGAETARTAHPQQPEPALCIQRSAAVMLPGEAALVPGLLSSAAGPGSHIPPYNPACSCLLRLVHHPADCSLVFFFFSTTHLLHYKAWFNNEDNKNSKSRKKTITRRQTDARRSRRGRLWVCGAKKTQQDKLQTKHALVHLEVNMNFSNYIYIKSR